MILILSTWAFLGIVFSLIKTTYDKFIFKRNVLYLFLSILCNKLWNILIPLKFINKIINNNFKLIKVIIYEDLVYSFSLILEYIFLFLLSGIYSVFLSDNVNWTLILLFLFLFLILIIMVILFMLLVHWFWYINRLNNWKKNQMKYFLVTLIKELVWQQALRGVVLIFIYRKVILKKSRIFDICNQSNYPLLE